MEKKEKKTQQFGVSREVEMIWKELRGRVVGECGQNRDYKSHKELVKILKIILLIKCSLELWWFTL